MIGKTTLLNSILLILCAKKVRCILCAPTGRAAKRLSDTTGIAAKTIHRLLEVSPGTGSFVRNEANPLDCDLLVVDETSMVDVPLMNNLPRALPVNESLLLLGDVDQLIIETPGELLLRVLPSGTVSTNVYLRRLRNFCAATRKDSPRRRWGTIARPSIARMRNGR
jgi:exodeoxyribonuclease V alpha subunit